MVGRLKGSGTLTFRALAADAPDMMTRVARFLALLELFREGVVSFDQMTPLGELSIRWTGTEDTEIEINDEFDGAPPEEPAPASTTTSDRRRGASSDHRDPGGPAGGDRGGDPRGPAGRAAARAGGGADGRRPAARRRHPGHRRRLPGARGGRGADRPGRGVRRVGARLRAAQRRRRLALLHPRGLRRRSWSGSCSTASRPG